MKYRPRAGLNIVSRARRQDMRVALVENGPMGHLPQPGVKH